MRRYFPRIVGLTPQDGFTDGNLFELLVLGRDEPGALSKLSSLLDKYRVNIIPSGGYHLLKPGTFVWTTFVDFSLTQITPEQVIGNLKGMSFVTQVEFETMDHSDFERFLFPVILMGRFRSAIFSIQPFLSVEKRLIEQFGPTGGVILFEEGKQYLVESIRQLGEVIPSRPPEALLENAVAWLRTTGWGIFEFDTSALRDAGGITVRISEPPIVEVAGLSKSNFVNGVTAGVIEAVFRKRASLQSESYDPGERRLTLVFRIGLGTSPSASLPSPSP